MFYLCEGDSYRKDSFDQSKISNYDVEDNLYALYRFIMDIISFNIIFSYLYIVYIYYKFESIILFFI